jgi:hypothetical protein
MAAPTGPHCESCGDPNPITDEGYTECCNELVCHGDYPRTWTSDSGHQVTVCCGFVAEQKFDAAGHGHESFWRN